jgi:hypothetical protein
LERGKWMEQHSEATWNAMTYAARLKLLPLTEAQAKASLAALDKSHKKKAKARAATASEARKPWKERTFVERLHLVIDDDETLAKHVVVEPDHSGAERNAMFQLGLKAWKKKQKNKQNKAEAVDKEADREKEKKKATRPNCCGASTRTTRPCRSTCINSWRSIARSKKSSPASTPPNAHFLRSW